MRKKKLFRPPSVLFWTIFMIDIKLKQTIVRS